MNEELGIIRILIADDKAIYRDGLKNLLHSEPAFLVVGEAGDGREAMSLARKLAPDILLLDLFLPQIAGMDVLRALAASGSKARTIVLGAGVDGEQIIEALQLGARGWLLREATTKMLFESIQCVMEGQYWISGQRVSSLTQGLNRIRDSVGKNAQPKTFGLTPREIQIVSAIVGGSANKSIAKQLSISEQTIKHHLTNIFDKLGVFNRLELVLFALHHGLVNNP